MLNRSLDRGFRKSEGVLASTILIRAQFCSVRTDQVYNVFSKTGGAMCKLFYLTFKNWDF